MTIKEVTIKKGKKIESLKEVDDLSKVKARSRIVFICEKCGKESEKRIDNFDGFFICSDCKKKESYLKKYGVDNPAKSKEIQKKIEETNLKKYGTRRATQSESVKSKYYQTFFERGLKATNFLIPLFEEKEYKGKKESYLWKCEAPRG